jgi:hypothetical protein
MTKKNLPQRHESRQKYSYMLSKQPSSQHTKYKNFLSTLVVLFIIHLIVSRRYQTKNWAAKLAEPRRMRRAWKKMEVEESVPALFWLAMWTRHGSRNTITSPQAAPLYDNQLIKSEF